MKGCDMKLCFIEKEKGSLKRLYGENDEGVR